MENKKPVRLFLAFVIGFFLIITVLTSFVIIPKINTVLTQQHIRDSAATLEIEKELLRRFVSNNRVTLEDLAAFPVITNAVLLSSSEDANFIDLVNNFSIFGEKAKLVLQDFAGEIIYQSTQDMQGDFKGDAPWIQTILNGEQPYNFQLLAQEGEHFSFILSVPVSYLKSIEGVLSAEISVPINSVFSPQLIADESAFKLRQNDIVVKTDTSRILAPEEVSTILTVKNMELTYISDTTSIQVEQHRLRNTILIVLFIGLAASFFLFIILGYKSLGEDSAAIRKIPGSTYIMPFILGGIGIAASMTAAFLLYNIQTQRTYQDTLDHNNFHILSIEQALIANEKAVDVLPVQDVFHQSIDVNFGDTALVVRDVTDSDNPQHIYGDIKGLEKQSDLSLSRVIYNAGRQWEITAYPASFDRQYNAVFLPLAILIGGFVFSVLVTITFIQIVRRREVIEAVVKQRTQELHDATQFQDLIMSNIPDLLFVKDHEFRIVNANPAFLNVYPEDIRDSVIGKTSIEGYAPEEAEEFLKFDKQAFAEGQSEVEETILFPDGKTRTLLTKKVSFENTGEKFVLGIGRDITAIKEAEAQREELRGAMENTVEGVSQIDPQGCYIYLNEAYAGACGYKPEELVGKNWEITVHKDDHEMMAKAYQYMLDTGKVVDEPRGIRKDGTVFFKRVTMISRYDDEGVFIGHHCFMSDISERKKAENELIRSNQELDDFAYIASHDLKEPLRGIYNHAKLFVEDYKDDLNDDGKHKLDRIMYLAQRMENLINDLLYYSRLGRSDEKFVETNLNDVVIDIKDMLPDEKNISIKIQGELPTIKCDRMHIAELFRNLITNAIKYNESDDKHVEIGSKIATTISNSKDRVFYVKDNGIGIDPRFHSDIFKIFKRLHKRDAYGGGTGSGLTFVKKIVEQHKGEIWVESELGKGTTFYFTLRDKK